MSKRITFRGNIKDGLQEKINLATLNGKTGYRITKFQIIGEAPASATSELVCKVFDKESTISATVDFTDASLLAVAYEEEHSNSTTFGGTVIIFDNQVFNQNIYVTAVDGSGGTKATNYYLELETIALSDIQSTQLTLKSLRTLAAD